MKKIGRVLEKAGEQLQKGAVRYDTRKYREAANEREKKCQAQYDAVKNQLATDDLILAGLKNNLESIKLMAEKIRSRDKGNESAFKTEISNNPEADCKKWLSEQESKEGEFHDSHKILTIPQRTAADRRGIRHRHI